MRKGKQKRSSLMKKSTMIISGKGVNVFTLQRTEVKEHIFTIYRSKKEQDGFLDSLTYGDFYKPRKARFIPTFCKRINRTSTAVGKWLTAFEEERRTTFSVTKFIYNNNNNKQGFTPNGTNNEYVRAQKIVQDSDWW